MTDTPDRASASTARVLIAEDHALVREGIRSMLEEESDLEVIAEAQDGLEALELSRKLCPDLILMDVRLPKMDGLEATRLIKQECLKTSVLMVTSHENPEYLLEAMRAGAAGYVLKEATQQEVVASIREVLDGEFPLDKNLALQLIRRLADEGQKEEAMMAAAPATSTKKPLREYSKPPPALAEPLSPRQVEVLGLLVQGYTNQEMAEQLFISVSTAKKHVRQVIEKLKVSDRTQAALRAVELGLLSTEEGRKDRR